MLRRPSLLDVLQAAGIAITSISVGAFDWRLGGILLGTVTTAIGIIHDGGDDQ
ncbi:MAG: hypothetical protein JWP11_1292 [Frankiales bacterium]|nr:hypothetical protein [Frankiales bacterium]